MDLEKPETIIQKILDLKVRPLIFHSPGPCPLNTLAMLGSLPFHRDTTSGPFERVHAPAENALIGL